MVGANRIWRSLGVLLAVLPLPLQAQFAFDGGAFQMDGDAFVEERMLEREISAAGSLVGHAERYIVVHLTENRVFVFEGERAIWSAPAGTGTGFELSTDEHYWDFSTPRGLMQVRRMEKDPMWEAPDWYYIENGLDIPSPTHPSRRIAGVMGTTAIYLGDGIAIHGTGSPELVLNPDPAARAVSHGCIRLTNEAARDLLHMVSVGTPVLIF